MNSEFPQDERAKLEAKLTALLLGELHADEVAALSKAMEKDPELAALYERLKVTIDLVREGTAQPVGQAGGQSAPLKLSAERREKLLASFKTVAPKEFAKPRRVKDWLVPMAACVAIVAVLATWLLQTQQLAFRGTAPGYAQLDQLASRKESSEKLSKDIGAIPPAAATPAPETTPTAATAAPGQQNGHGFALIGPVPATPPSAAPEIAAAPRPEIVLPSDAGGGSQNKTPDVPGFSIGQTFDAGAVPGQQIAAGGITDNMRIYYARSSDIGDGLKKLAEQSNAVVSQNSWGFGPSENRGIAGEETKSEFGKFKPDSVAPEVMAFTNGFSSGTPTVAFNNGSYNAQTYYRTLSQLGTDSKREKAGVDYVTNLFGDSSGKVPVLGDAAAVGRMFRSEIMPAQGADFKTALTTDDVNGLRNLYTNAAVTAQPISGDTFATASVLMNRESQSISAAGSRPSFAGANTFGGAVANNGTLTVNGGTHVSGIVQGEGKKAEIVLPSGSGTLLTSGLRDQAAEAGMPITLSEESGGFGGGGGGGGAGGGGPSRSNVRRPVSGKQVEIAAAANPAVAPRQSGRLETETVKVDAAKLYNNLDAAPGSRFAEEYDNPGNVVPTIQAGNGGIPLTGQLPLPRSRVREVETNTSTGRGLRYVTGLDSTIEVQQAVRNYLQSAGVKLDPSKGESVFYNDRQGTLTVRGTDEDLDKVQAAIDALNAPKPNAVVGAKFAEVNTNDSGAAGYQWYLGNMVMTNGAVVASGGTTPAADVWASESARGTRPSAESMEKLKQVRETDAQTRQFIQDGKLMYQLGKYDDAESKLNEALDRDPGNQAAQYYLSLLKQSRVRQVVDNRNVTSMNRMVQVEKGWVDNSARGKLPVPSTPRSNSASNWWNTPATVRTFYDDNANAVAATNNVNIAAYAALKEKLNNAKQWREVLAMKAHQEAVDVNLPKARMVTIMDHALVTPAEKPSLGEKIRSAFSGKVERTARIQVEQERPDVAGVGTLGNIGSSYDPYFLQTEFEAIRSDAVLKKVVDELELDGGDKSRTEEAVKQLRKDLDVGSVKNTKFITIGARSEKAEDAARIADAVAQAYRNYRAEEYDELKNHGINNLKQQLAEQDQRIAVLQTNVDELTKRVNVSGVTAGIPISVAQNDPVIPKPTVPPPTPQPEVLTRKNAVSTFSLNVSDVSFKLAAASLEKGQMPEPASIRSEEFINAFDYRDPDARDGAAIAFASERARYPFAHNRELLRFSLKTAAAGRQAGRPLNIVLLLDNSGSMERADRVRIIQEALRVLAGQLQASDVFSIVTFARTAQLRVDGVPGNQAAAAAGEIAKLTPEGGTNLGEALELAYETARHHYLANGDNRVVLLTDGAANLGDVEPEVLKKKVEAQRQQGVALDCFGIGWEGYNDDLLEVLTRNGDGRYGFINTPEEADTEFVAQIAGALHVAASDVKVQVEFNPKRVTSYRQIGYAKHQLTKEQFRDNTVDAAEIAAQEAGNALYTIETNPDGEGSIATVRVRYKVPGTAEYREQAWDVPYTGSAVALDQASPAMRLAGTASAFSEWLSTSPFAAEVSTERLLNYLSDVPQVYGADTRPAKLEWMIRQARSISGK